MEIQAELDRVATFAGAHINSSVLHGSQQRFPIKVRSSCQRASSAVECAPTNKQRRKQFYFELLSWPVQV